MAGIHVFTSISFSYLAKARILAFSLKRFHPDWVFWVCISDREPPGFTLDLSKENFDRVVWGHDLSIKGGRGWFFKHNIIELCTAIKGPMLEKLLRLPEAEKILYLDPDIAIFAPLNPIVDALEDCDIVLTPHQIHPDSTHEAIVDNEIASLQHGIYNLGFVGVRAGGEGARFSKWWSDRLMSYCYDDIPSGLFVDQRWCDLIPAFFERVKVLRDPGYNVACWNLNQRAVTLDQSGNLLVNGSPLRFYHFTKIEGAGLRMVVKYARDNIHIFEMVSWYKYWLTRFAEPSFNKKYWYFGMFADGAPIRTEYRLLYRRRAELQKAFPDPFISGPDSYQEWLERNNDVWKSVGVTNGPASLNERQTDPIAFTSLSRWFAPAKQLIGEALGMQLSAIAVYGAGEVGRTLLPEAINSGLNVKWVIDRNPLLWGQKIEGVNVVRLSQAVEEGANSFVIASFSFADEIRHQIMAQFAGRDVRPFIVCKADEG
jgi:hypothetical protein